jgi:hypothetical protein
MSVGSGQHKVSLRLAGSLCQGLGAVQKACWSCLKVSLRAVECNCWLHGQATGRCKHLFHIMRGWALLQGKGFRAFPASLAGTALPLLVLFCKHKKGVFL